MALASLSDLKLFLGITSTANDSSLQWSLLIAEQAAKSFIGRDLELQQHIEYYDGEGRTDIVLRHFPICLESAPRAWLSASGYYGQGSGFDSESELVSGADFVIVPHAHILRRLGTGIRGQMLGRPHGSLAARWRQAVWPVGQGNVKVQYSAGYAEIPTDVVGAVLQLAAWTYQTRTWGGQFVNAASLGEYRRNLVNAMNGHGADADKVGSFAMLLRPYRELVI